MAPTRKDKGKGVDHDDNDSRQQRHDNDTWHDEARKIDEALARSQKKKQTKKKLTHHDIDDDNDDDLEYVETEREILLRGTYFFLIILLFWVCSLTC